MIKLFTHTDLDGIGCAILALYAFEQKVEITYCDYNNINEKVKEFYTSLPENQLLWYSECYITDISVSSEVAEIIDKSILPTHLLDHHETALCLNKYDWCDVVIEKDDIQTCGTELFYSWLRDNQKLMDVPALGRFVEVIRNYDTWRWASMGAEGVISDKINKLFGLYGRDKFILWALCKIYDNSFPRLHSSDDLILDVEQSRIDEYVSQKARQITSATICGHYCGVVFAENYVSELGNRLCKMFPNFDFVAIIDMAACKVSYRTVKDNIDLGRDVAAKFGGGGHVKAAGSQITPEFQRQVIKKIFNVP